MAEQCSSRNTRHGCARAVDTPELTGPGQVRIVVRAAASIHRLEDHAGFMREMIR